MSASLSNMTEWRICDGFPDYAVSEDGQVRRATASPWATVGKILSPGRKSSGHLIVSIRPPNSRKPVSVKVHQLVARAFLGPKPDWAECVAHNDGKADHNHWRNLRWATLKQNQADRALHGTEYRGERNHLSKLSDACVARIREATLFGARRQDLGPVYGVHPGHIWHLLKRAKPIPQKQA